MPEGKEIVMEGCDVLGVSEEYAERHLPGELHAGLMYDVGWHRRNRGELGIKNSLR